MHGVSLDISTMKEVIINLLTNPEVLLAAGGFVLNLLILPTIIDSDAAVPRTQSVLSAVILLLCFAVPYVWIGFYWSAFANTIGVILWTLVAIYRSPDHHDTKEKSPSSSPTSAD